MQKSIKSFDGVRINYDIFRNSRSFIVFLHGAGGNLTVWDNERSLLHSKGYSSIAIDLRGHGNSERPKLLKDYTLEKFGKDIMHIIDNEKIKDFMIVGHSFGGIVTIMFHKLFPRVAKSYILIGTTCKAPSALKAAFKKHSPFINVLNNLLEGRDTQNVAFSRAKFDRYVGTGDWNLLRIFSDVRHTSLKSWLFTYQYLAGFNGIGILKSIKKPVLIIRGEKDSIFDLKVAQKIKKIVKNSKLSIVPGANHIIVLNNPDAVEKEIYGFLAGNE